MRSLFILLLAAGLDAQQLDLSGLEKLNDRARESSVVSLDPEKLRLVAGFLSGGDSNEKRAQDLVSGLKAVYVRSFEFDKPGAYSPADLEPIRRQLKAPGWAKVIEVKEKDETSEIYLFNAGGNRGMAVLSAEKTELTVVNLIGTVNLGALGQLGRAFGIPNIQTGFASPADKPGKLPPPAQPPKPKQPEEDDEN